MISDRYIASGLVIQRFDDVDPMFLWQLNEEAEQPDLAVLRRSEQDKVTIQIVPQQHSPLGIAHNSFTLLSFPDKDEPDMAHTQDHPRPHW